MYDGAENPSFFRWVQQSETRLQMTPKKKFCDQPHLNLRALFFMNMVILSSQSKPIHRCKNQISPNGKLNLARGRSGKGKYDKKERIKKVVVITRDFLLSSLYLNVFSKQNQWDACAEMNSSDFSFSFAFLFICLYSVFFNISGNTVVKSRRGATLNEWAWPIIVIDRRSHLPLTYISLWICIKKGTVCRLFQISPLLGTAEVMVKTR